MYLLTVLLPLVTACIITAIATPIALIFIKKIGLFDDPARHKHPAILHSKPIPRGGGIPLFIGIFISSLFFLPMTPVTIALYVAAFLTLTIGVLDDKYDISPYIRFAINILTGTIVVGSGIAITYITNPFGGILHLDKLPFFTLFGVSLLPGLISLVWIVWVMNMLNWSKGVDGQMPGIVAISALVIGLLSLRFNLADSHTYIAATLSFILAGAALGFLPYNFAPAKIFPGYGATCLYLLLAAVSILSGAKLATAILVMGVPMVDGAFTVLRRLLSGKSPFRHDNKHLHHLLLRAGFTPRHIALFYWGISAIVGAISLMLSSTGKLFAISMLIVIVGGGLLFLHRASHTDEKTSL